MRMMFRAIFGAITMAANSVYQFFSAINRLCTAGDHMAEWTEDEARNFRDVGRIERHQRTVEIKAQLTQLGYDDQPEPGDAATVVA